MMRIKKVSTLLAIVLVFSMMLTPLSSLAAEIMPISTPLLISESNPNEYLVQKGDTLSKVSAQFGIPVGTLAALNGISDKNAINAGTLLRLNENGTKGTKLTIMHTNDTHSRVLGDDKSIGFATIQAIADAEWNNNQNFMLLDAGDTLHGQTYATVTKGESIIKVMNAMGYFAMTGGNHDYNYGIKRLKELDKMANFPVLVANIHDANGKNPFTAYKIRNYNGVKVAVFGLSTPETLYKTSPANVAGYTFEDPVVTAKKMVSLLEGKADVIIALSHLGVEGDFTSDRLAENVPEIDVIIDGHSHSTFDNKMVNGVLLAQTGEYDKNVGLVDIVVDNGKIVSKSSRLISKAQSEYYGPNERIAKIINHYVESNKKITTAVVGKTDILLDGERNNVRAGESNLGNLLTSSMLAASGADVAITNGGGIRASIKPGEITLDHIITVLPFGNYSVVKSVKGQQIWDAIEFGIGKQVPDGSFKNGGFPHVAGMTYKYDSTKPEGKRVVELLIAGNPVDLNGTYKLVTNDFMAIGGDGYTMLGKNDPTLAELPTMDEILIDYIKNNGTAAAKVEGRMVDIAAVAVKAA